MWWHQKDLHVWAWALTTDRLFGEYPNCVHPVVGLGHRVTHHFDAWRGVFGPSVKRAGRRAALLVLAETVFCAWCADKMLGAWALPRAALLKGAFSLETLVEAASRVGDPLDVGDIDKARRQLAWLCSRDSSEMCADALYGAAISSIAENAADSVIAPFCYWAVGGVPAAWAYRAINTMDAMVGYYGPWQDAGQFAANLDDIASWLPSRFSALCIVLAAAIHREHAWQGVCVAVRDHGRTTSPNGGWPMAAMAGVLDVRLEKEGYYILHEEGHAPDAHALRQAQVVGRTAMWLGAGVALLLRIGLLSKKQTIQRSSP